MRSPFGWNYPAGAEHDPRAPWNEPEEPEYVRLDRVFSDIAKSATKRSRQTVTIETDGFEDEDATVIVRIDRVDWSRAEEEVEETIRDILSAMEAKRGVR